MTCGVAAIYNLSFKEAGEFFRANQSKKRQALLNLNKTKLVSLAINCSLGQNGEKFGASKFGYMKSAKVAEWKQS